MEGNTLSIHDIPRQERPRERLLQDGPAQLSNQELLAILLRTGTRTESVLTLATRVLHYFDGLYLLKDATIEELQKVKGIGPTKALELQAALELGKRINKLQITRPYVIHSPEDAARYVMHDMRLLTQEHFVGLYLNTKNHVVSKQTLFIGSLNASIVHPREVFKEALRRSAAAVICVHNHPSGDPTPSKEDIEVTKRLAECGKLLGIDLLDHIIIGDNAFKSMKEQEVF